MDEVVNKLCGKPEGVAIVQAVLGSPLSLYIVGIVETLKTLSALIKEINVLLLKMGISSLISEEKGLSPEILTN